MNEDNWRDWFHITKDWKYIELDKIENNHLIKIINLANSLWLNSYHLRLEKRIREIEKK